MMKSPEVEPSKRSLQGDLNWQQTEQKLKAFSPLGHSGGNNPRHNNMSNANRPTFHVRKK